MKYRFAFHPGLVLLGLVLFAASAGAPFLGTARAGQSAALHFQEVKQRLISEETPGLDAKYITAVFDSPGLEFAVKGISAYFRHRESKLNYGQFTETYSIAKAADYLRKYQGALNRAENKFGVCPEVITAIALVETRLGTYTGSQNVLEILASMAALADKGMREQFWRQLPAEDRLPKNRYEIKAGNKARWAYRELKAFLQYTRQQGLDPSSVPGSYAGAIGIAQFMPTNILLLAEDGSRDGKIDMFDHEDAIFSIGRFLSRYGWKPGISRKKAKKVILYYNRSSYYANTILDIADKLREQT